MYFEQKRWTDGAWSSVHDSLQSSADLVLAFGDRAHMESAERFDPTLDTLPAGGTDLLLRENKR